MLYIFELVAYPILQISHRLSKSDVIHHFGHEECVLCHIRLQTSAEKSLTAQLYKYLFPCITTS